MNPRKPGHCVICDNPVYEFTVDLKTQITTFGKAKEGAERVTVQLTDGSVTDWSVCSAVCREKIRVNPWPTWERVMWLGYRLTPDVMKWVANNGPLGVYYWAPVPGDPIGLIMKPTGRWDGNS